MTETVATSNSTETSSCPVNHSVWSSFAHTKTSKTESNNTDSNEHSQKGCTSDFMINESNNMPLIANQQPSMGQRVPLGTSRQLSNIPRAIPETDKNLAKKAEVWIYPSEQMFFNAMKRKNWNPREEDMRVIVPMHNAVNEKAWREILEWEKFHE
ncbi:2061_t:CDS:1, partial [Acaulospora colombiana]